MAWRLSQGPIDLAWFTTRLEEAANANGGPTRLAIGSAALAWEGFRKGVDRPLDLRLTDVTVTDQAGGRRHEYPARRRVAVVATNCCSGASCRGRWHWMSRSSPWCGPPTARSASISAV